MSAHFGDAVHSRRRVRRLLVGGMFFFGGALGSGAVHAGQCPDPVANPLTAGWTKSPEGTGVIQVGGIPTQLTLADPGPGANDFINFFCPLGAELNSDIVLTPHFTIDPGFASDPANGSTGVHVTINSAPDITAAKMIRVVLIQTGPAAMKIALQLVDGTFSPGFVVPNLIVDFTLKRLFDGTAVLSVANPVPGEPPLQEQFASVDLPDATQPATLEFGTYGGAAASCVTRWDTLGLATNKDFPIGLAIQRMRIRDDNNDKLRIDAKLTLGPGSDGINPVTEGADLRVFVGANQVYPPQGSTIMPVQPGEFEARGGEVPRKWRLTDAASARTRIERFNILIGRNDLVFVDRQTDLPAGQSFANVTVKLVIGNDEGEANVTLQEKPPGSGRWRLP